ncbi:putative enzyme [Xenorhabdus bovienii str. Jollieti]|uniref:Putative enzyme n=1 Tax=Xenorhabdus bovienii (strain SS-2004) TaxID=406818 RepID=D3UWW2_XENBS|nr:envelope biogenesis factor ElyC [Xenorhabdus bovienii]CBJ79947.1 putative enzyme [Xenorhabdus bovienii SS-2004]CDH29650.1 putative enzyme [Xenorhabdus bovienii str. Jollieti]
MLFLLKKYVGALLMPLPLIILVSLTALLFLWFTRWQKTGKALLSLSWLALLLFSLQPIADKLLLPIEGKYVQRYEPDKAYIAPVKYIVVLGGGFTYNPQWAPSANLISNSLPRVTEGIRLYHLNPGTKMIFTGGKGVNSISSAEIAAMVAQSLGIPVEDTIALREPLDTEEEAAEVEKVLGQQPFILVTSANHMERSLKFFERRGMHPIAGPANQLAVTTPLYAWEKYIPSAYYFSHTERAWYETLGKIWQAIKPVTKEAATEKTENS